MPGLTNNTNILNANNQFIQSQNDIEAALLAGHEITAEQLRLVGLWHPYLKYLKYLQAIAENEATGSVTTFPGTYQEDNDIYLSEKCIAANWIYQSLINGFDKAMERTWDKISFVGSSFAGAIETVLLFALGTISLPLMLAASLPSLAILYLTSPAVFNPSSVKDALTAHKDAIIRSIYNAVSLDLFELQLTLPITRLSNISEDVVEIIKTTYPLSVVEQQVIGLIIDYYAQTALFKDSTSWPTKWQSGAPAGSVVCADSGSSGWDGIGQWYYGTPDLIVDGYPQNGSTTTETNPGVSNRNYISFDLGQASTIIISSPSGRVAYLRTTDGNDTIIDEFYDALPEFPIVSTGCQSVMISTYDKNNNEAYPFADVTLTFAFTPDGA